MAINHAIGTAPLRPAPGERINGTVQLGHYRLGAKLGEGGYGQVFEAWDERLCRKVAVKRLKRLDRIHDMQREAQLAASLRHPAFVKVYGLEYEGENQMIVMELVEGQTLKELLQITMPPQAQALKMVRQVAAAMSEAHACQLFHGDLKPANLMLDDSGMVRILDFGLASQEDSQATCSGAPQDTPGTIAYMAPERLMGGTSDSQSEIYALGVILYELVTGTRPFAELNGMALAATLTQSKSDQWFYPEDLPSKLIKLIRSMTARKPAQRMITMQDVVISLDALISPTREEIYPCSIEKTTRHHASQRSRMTRGLNQCLRMIITWQSLPLIAILLLALNLHFELLAIKDELHARLICKPYNNLVHEDTRFNVE